MATQASITARLSTYSSRLSTYPSRLPAAGWVAGLTVFLLVIYGPGPIGYDAAYALVWGNDIVNGRLPEFETATAPTPHPLANVSGAVLSLLGESALDAFVIVHFVALAALGYAGFLLGRRLFSVPVGLLFALILLTRATLVHEAAIALVDVPFLALVVAAAALEVGPRERPGLVMALLALSGLLRPEGWLVATVYALYRWPRHDLRGRLGLVAGVVAAPLLWAGFDLVVAGDPLHSLNSTRELADRLDRPRGVDTALASAARYLQFVLGGHIVWLGLAGSVLALVLLYEHALLPSALAGLGLMTFLVLGAAGLPVLTRYLLIPALVFALFAAVAVLGWISLREGRLAQRVWTALGVLLAVVLGAGAPEDVRAIQGRLGFLDRRAAGQDRLRDLVAIPAAKAAVVRCGRAYVPNSRPVPLITYVMGLPSTAVVVGRPSAGESATLVKASTPELAASFSLDDREAQNAAQPPPPGFRRVVRNEAWTLYASC
jgi:hypothetical protein